MAGPLTGLRVLDLSRILAGPWSGQTLADLGAEVIKVERPGTGDDTRGWGPPFLPDDEGKPTSESAYYLSCNRGKKSVTINMSKPAGQHLIRQIAAKSDFLIENFKVGDLPRYSLGYDDLHKVNPALIYCSITGFGQTGPYKDHAGYDLMIQGMGGLMSLTGRADGEPGAGPIKAGVAIVDIFTGLYATVAMLAALEHRRKTGEGQHIDLALLDVQVATLANQAMNYLTTGVSPKRLGNAHPNISPYEVIETKDGYMILAVGNDRQFTSFCAAAETLELANDPRFISNLSRVQNRAVLVPIIADILILRPTAQWISMLARVDVPCGPINAIEGVFADTQIQHRGMCVKVPHPQSNALSLVKSPINYSATPIGPPNAPPLLGQQTKTLLRDLLALDGVSLNALAAEGVI
ncbi:CaiB/BaiF CoA transferase family protein [Bradyrhizobium denitrificans]